MMAKKKIYAVRKGNKTGLFYSWDECKKAVHGYSGAEYKGFLTKDEAEAFLNIGKITREYDHYRNGCVRKNERNHL